MAESQRTTTEKATPGKWAKYGRTKRARWLAAGVCGSCGRERDNDSLTCTRCLEKLSERSRLSRARAQAKKLVECGPRPPRKFDDNASCKRSWRVRWKAAGLCTSCGAARDVEGRVRCRKCLDFDRASHKRHCLDPQNVERSARDSRGKCERRQRRIAEGLCGTCGERPAAPRRKHCEPCLAIDRAKTMVRVERFRAQGLCVHCGAPPVTVSLCGPCLEKANVRSHTRRVRMEANPGHLTVGQWRALKKAQDYRCLCCGRREPEIRLTIDHVIPVSRGGSNAVENCQGLCADCNSAKFTRDTDYRTNPI
jgi:5-methylcytosine-specific restriction endonuclease McrA